jgi:hypothetical protein
MVCPSLDSLRSGRRDAHAVMVQVVFENLLERLLHLLGSHTTVLGRHDDRVI